MKALRLVSYLSPSLPQQLFRDIVDHLSKESGVALELEFDSSVSGPRAGCDPFLAGHYDGAFLCAPSALALAQGDAPSVDIVPAAPVFADPRLQGKPHYYSDVVIRADHPAQEFADLRGSRWGYNDPCSLSGYFSTHELVAPFGSDTTFFQEVLNCGSHLNCLEHILSGRIDGAAIDSNTLLLQRRHDPRLAQLRVLTSAGPYPVQPLVLSTRHRELTPHFGDILLNLPGSATSRRLQEQGVEQFASICLADYQRDCPKSCRREATSATCANTPPSPLCESDPLNV